MLTPRQLLILTLTLALSRTALADNPPPPDQLLFNTLRTLQSAPHLSVDVRREIRTLATGPIANPEHQAFANMIYTITQSVALERPNRFRIDQSFDSPPRTSRSIAILDHGTLLLANQRDPARPWTGHTGAFPENSIDALLDDADDTGIPVHAREISLLLASQAYERFFQYVTHLEFLGAANDISIPVWRMRFQDLDDPPATWELWITQEGPPRLTRLHISRPSSISISNDEKNSSFSNYPITENTECVFSHWNLDTPLPADAFIPPAGHFTRATYRKDPFPLGATVPLPTLSDTTGTPVPITNPTGPVLLEFWRTENDWNAAQLEALVHTFTPQGLRLYIIDIHDSPAQLRDYFAKTHRPQPPILLDPDQTYEKSLGNDAWPALLLLSPDGKLLAHENPSSLGLARLKTALTAATTPPTK